MYFQFNLISHFILFHLSVNILITVHVSLIPLSFSQAVICIDNAPWHSRAEEQWNTVLSRLEANPNRDWILLRMAPYSFSCSPIERYWSSFKSGVKSAFRDRRDELLEPAPPGGESMTSRRSRILREVATEQSTEHAAIHNLQAYFNSVQGIIAQASNGDDVPIGV